MWIVISNAKMPLSVPQGCKLIPILSHPTSPLYLFPHLYILCLLPPALPLCYGSGQESFMVCIPVPPSIKLWTQRDIVIGTNSSHTCPLCQDCSTIIALKLDWIVPPPPWEHAWFRSRVFVGGNWLRISGWNHLWLTLLTGIFSRERRRVAHMETHTRKRLCWDRGMDGSDRAVSQWTPEAARNKE